MKKKNGFTLIELLAVIVVLAVIALIAVPLIMGIIDDAKMGSFKDSIYGILKATDLAVAREDNNNFSFYVDGTKIKDTFNKELEYKGESMKDGMISYDKNGHSSLILWNGTYCGLKNKNDSEVKVKKASSISDCAPKYKVGDEIILSDRSRWHVIDIDPDNPLEITILSDYNMKVNGPGNYVQDDTDKDFNSKNPFYFDPTNRRTTANGNSYCVNSSSLGCNAYSKNGTTITMDSFIKEIANEYKEGLIKNGVISSKNDVSLISREQLEKLGCNPKASGNTGNCNNAPSWLKDSSYWTKTSEGTSAVDVWVVYNNGVMSYDCASRGSTFGFRPVITIPIVAVGAVSEVSKPTIKKDVSAVWMWEANVNEMLASETEMKNKFNILQNNKINTIYLDMNPNKIMNYEKIVREANKRNIRIFCLIGDPAFINSANYKNVINNNMDKIYTFNRYLDGSAKVEGIHYDVEPGGFSDTDFGSGLAINGQTEAAKKQKRRVDFLTFARTAKSYADSKNLLVEHDVTPYMNMETFYDTDGVEKNMLEELMKVSDGISLMSYGNGTKNTMYPILLTGSYHHNGDPTNITINVDKNYIERATKHNLPIIIGQDIQVFKDTAKELADDPSLGPIYLPEYQNASGKTDYKFTKKFVNRVMNEIKDKTKAELSNKKLDNTFGFAFHDYRYLADLINQSE